MLPGRRRLCSGCPRSPGTSSLVEQERCWGRLLLLEEAAAAGGGCGCWWTLAACGGELLLGACCWRRGTRMSCCRGRPLGPCTGWHPQSAGFGPHPDWEAGFVYTYSLCAASVPGAISVAPVGALHPRAAGPARVDWAPVHVALPSRRQSLTCAGFVMTHLGWSYYDGPEACVNELSPRFGGSRHDVPGARRPPSGWSH